MLFNSYEFLFGFLPLALGAFLALGTTGRLRAALGLLVVSSIIYHAWLVPWHSAILVGSMLANFTLGRGILRNRAEGAPFRGQLLLILGVALDLGLIAGFKYAYFLAETLRTLTGWHHTLTPAVLPLGISFFTFQQLAYLVDAWRGRAGRVDFLHYLVFVSFFPQLIAGPIVRYEQVVPQLTQGSLWQRSSLVSARGMSLFVIGLFKKVVLADGIAPHANAVFDAASAGAVGFWTAWSGALAYTFQIYFDFSGYSDMAIGLGLLFGLRLPQNFDSPYKATSIVEFWRRWHMTLSLFLRDYLYVPLGGNRHGRGRRYANLTVTMLLGGLWHGASWTFVLWGGLHAVYLLLNHAWFALTGGSAQARGGPWRNGVARLLTFLAVVVAWVVFRGGELGTIQHMYGSMFGLAAVGSAPSASMWGCLALLLTIVWLAPNSDQWVREAGGRTPSIAVPAWRPSPAMAALLALIAVAAVLLLSRGFTHENEFIYYQF